MSSLQPDGLADAFTSALAHRPIHEVPKAVRARFSRTIAMVYELGGVAAVRRLVGIYYTQPSEVYTRLWEHERLDFSFEALMVTPRFAPLFTKDELLWALRRLADYQYTPPASERYDVGRLV